jgi:hypothetical protein
VQRLQKGDLPDAGVAGDQKNRSRCLRAEADQIGANHHCSSRETIGEHPADEQEPNERHRPRGEHVAKIGGATRQVENREGQRHRRDRVAELRDDLARKEQTEVALLKNAQAGPTHHLSVIAGEALLVD